MAEIYDNITATIGETPLVRLSRVFPHLPNELLGKIEYFNPGGSVKDRIAIRMVREAERSGLLKPGGTLIEPTSGNTGIGLAMVAAALGYRMIMVTTRKASVEKVTLARSYGAGVVQVPVGLSADHPDSIYNTANRLAEQIPGSFIPDQYRNPANPDAHYFTTGKEIIRQTDGEFDCLVGGIGTGGTIVGAARAVKEHDSNIRVAAVDPPGSMFTNQEPAVSQIEGIGADYIPEIFDDSDIDRIFTVSDMKAVEYTQLLARREGILCSASSGAALRGAELMAAEIGPDARIVVILPDTGERYLSKYFNDDWLREHGLEPADNTGNTGPEINSKAHRLCV